jgi:dihydropyrimidinase
MLTASISRRAAMRTLAAASLGLAGAPAAALSSLRQPRELLVRGGRVVNADGTSMADVRIVDGVIVEVAPNLAPAANARIIDATRRLVLPGGIDPHTHLHPGFVDDFTTGSRAALAGGITTVGTFAFASRDVTLVQAVDRVAEQVSSGAIADVILHAAVWPPPADAAAQLRALAERGQPSFKIFMTGAEFGAHTAALIALLEAARDAGVLIMVHCEDGALLAASVRRLQAAGTTSLEHYAQSRPVIAEVKAAETAVALCEFSGARMYAVHVSSARALEVFTRARDRGLPFHVETRPLYLHLDAETTRGDAAVLALGQPPMRTRADGEALWAGLAEGRVDVLATDHAPWRREQKLDPKLNVARVRPGFSNLQFMLPMYFSEGVGKRGLSLERFVATTSTNAARLFGLYPRKGVIQAGADGDIVVWDPERSRVVRGEDDFSNADYSPYEGWQVTGWPSVVVRRGDVVVDDGTVGGGSGTGELIGRAPAGR